jgi:hypothetical protein
MRPGQPSTGHRIAAIARPRPANSTRLGSNHSANNTARTLTKPMRCQRGRIRRCQRRSWSGPRPPAVDGGPAGGHNGSVSRPSGWSAGYQSVSVRMDRAPWRSGTTSAAYVRDTRPVRHGRHQALTSSSWSRGRPTGHASVAVFHEVAGPAVGVPGAAGPLQQPCLSTCWRRGRVARPCQPGTAGLGKVRPAGQLADPGEGRSDAVVVADRPRHQGCTCWSGPGCTRRDGSSWA